jgi:hypothetical protein
MFLNIIRASRSESLTWLTLEEAGHDGLGFGGHVGREVEGVGEDALVHCVDVFVVEGGEAGLVSEAKWRVVNEEENRGGEREKGRGREGRTIIS